MADLKVGASVSKFATIANTGNEVLQPGAVSRLQLGAPGLKANRSVVVNKPTVDTGVFLIESRIPADDTVEVALWNSTGAPVTLAAQNFYVVSL